MSHILNSEERVELFNAVRDRGCTSARVLARRFDASLSVVYSAIRSVEADPTTEVVPKPRKKLKAAPPKPKAEETDFAPTTYRDDFDPLPTPVPWPNGTPARFICQGDNWRKCLV